MMISEDNPEQLVRAEDGILADIWDALRKEETIHSLDLSGLSIKVENGEVYLDGYLKEENQPLVESTIHSVVGVVEVHNHLRTNDGILADIWDALWKEDTIRSLDLGSLSIDVKDGEVYLNGHLAQENNLLADRKYRPVRCGRRGGSQPPGYRSRFDHSGCPGPGQRRAHPPLHPSGGRLPWVDHIWWGSAHPRAPACGGESGRRGVRCARRDYPAQDNWRKPEHTATAPCSLALEPSYTGRMGR